MAEHPHQLRAGETVGNYTIQRLLRYDSFSITYEASDNSRGERVTLMECMPSGYASRDPRTRKVIPQNPASFRWFLDNFRNEATWLSTLQHPGIAKAERSFSALDTSYIVMPYAEGETLEEYSRRCGTPSEKMLRQLLSGLLAALDHMHGKDLLHGGIKPSKILLLSNGEAQFPELSAARRLSSKGPHAVIESAGYTPDELLQKEGTVGPWSDLYALGASLYWLITHERPPRSADRTSGKADCIPLARRPELKGRYAAELLSGIDKAMSLNIAERWQSAADWEAAVTPKPPSPAPAVNRGAHTEVLFGSFFTPPAPPSPPAPLPSPASQPLRCLAFSPDGSVLAAGDDDGGIHLWSCTGYSPLRANMSHGAGVNALAFSKDGTQLASASDDGIARLWDMNSYRRIGQDMEHAAPVTDLAFSPVYYAIATAAGRNACIWGTDTQSEAGAALQHQSSLWALAFSPNGNYLATAEQYIHICETETGRLARSIDFPATSLAFSPDGSLLAAAADDGSIRLLDMARMQPVGQDLNHGEWVQALAFSPDGQILATVGSSSVRLWNSRTLAPLGETLPHEGKARRRGIAFSPDGMFIAAAGDRDIRFWNVPRP